MSDLSDDGSNPFEGDYYGAFGGDHDDDRELSHFDEDQNGSGSESSQNDEDDDDHEDDEEVEAERSVSDHNQRGQDIDVSKFILCGKHKSGHMVPDSCSSCAAGLSLIKDKETIKKLTNNNQSGSDGILSRYQGRCDTAAPTLVLSTDTIQLALDVFTKGVFKDTRMWAEIVKNYLSLPIEQHDLLNNDIKFEDVLIKYRKENRFQNLFKYGSDLARSLKNLRISQ